MGPCSLHSSRCSGLARCAFTCLAALVVSGAAARAEEPLRVMIDRLVALQTADYDKLAAPVCGDDDLSAEAPPRPTRPRCSCGGTGAGHDDDAT